jgi:hypothetical protein
MSLTSQLFTLEELDALDEKQLEILNDAIHVEIAKNPEVHHVLRRVMTPEYRKLKNAKRE